MLLDFSPMEKACYDIIFARAQEHASNILQRLPKHPGRRCAVCSLLLLLSSFVICGHLQNEDEECFSNGGWCVAETQDHGHRV